MSKSVVIGGIVATILIISGCSWTSKSGPTSVSEQNPNNAVGATTDRGSSIPVESTSRVGNQNGIQ